MAKEKKNNEKVQELLGQLEAGVSAVFTSDNYKRLLSMMGKFHHYSLRNNLLILTQMPMATICASFQLWKKIGYPVKKGSKGIKILVPIPYKYTVKAKSDGEDKDTEEAEEDETVEGLTFRVGNVFDVSQVSGELPEITKDLSDDSPELRKAVDDIITAVDYITYDDKLLKSKSTKGYYSKTDDNIYLRPEMSASQTMKTLIHEMGHKHMHADKDCIYNQHEREVQAESVAFVVCSAFGIDTSSYSFGYIAGWAKNQDLRELQASLNLINETAQDVIKWISEVCDLKAVECLDLSAA